MGYLGRRTSLRGGYIGSSEWVQTVLEPVLRRALVPFQTALSELVRGVAASSVLSVRGHSPEGVMFVRQAPCRPPAAGSFTNSRVRGGSSL
jgi:hypothetical protein